MVQLPNRLPDTKQWDETPNAKQRLRWLSSCNCGWHDNFERAARRHRSGSAGEGLTSIASRTRTRFASGSQTFGSPASLTRLLRDLMMFSRATKPTISSPDDDEQEYMIQIFSISRHPSILGSLTFCRLTNQSRCFVRDCYV